MAFINVQVKLNDVDISQYVVSYTREHKICTGIGTLSMEVTYELVNDIIPWDAIDIYEEGDHVGTYYVGSISDNQPSATINIEAQDNSKRLSDYFITDTYLIDYISYTRFWIEYFLQEVGIQYEFLVSGAGSLINQNTSLGLASAYEQIQTLLQMSGWYITFNTSGKALIGKLTTDTSSHSHRLNLNDITEFKLIQSDKMYRNRALIWGAGSPSSGEWVFADVTRHSRWDYDNDDVRTVVIANSNIPDVASAFMLANQLLIEFCRLNEEKDITLVGTYNNMNVGSSVYVHTRAWTGSGLVTTFGVNMSRSGLTTHIILDERCPRLYGFFDVGGKVYVGTYGSGVWRHDIKQLGAEWEDYSSGVAPQTTDLHVNNGLLTAVGAGGDAYYNLEGSLPWHQFSVYDLPYVVSGGVAESGVVTATISGVISSGLMVRACILDRVQNRLRYAVDTRSGYNLGDYLMETDGLTLSGQFSVLSGVVAASSGLRSWIVDGNPYDGSIGEVFPVNVSGNFECAIFDIENDGVTDYVSVGVLSSGFLIPNFAGLFDFGYRTNNVFRHDGRISTAFNQTGTFETTSGHYLAPSTTETIPPISIYNNTIGGERDIVYLGSDSAQRRFYYDRINVGESALTRTQKSTLGTYKKGTFGIFRSGELFKIYGQNGNDVNNVIVDEWDSSTGAVNMTSIGTITYDPLATHGGMTSIAVGKVIYIFTKVLKDDSRVFDIYKYELDTETDELNGPEIIFEGTNGGRYLEAWYTVGTVGSTKLPEVYMRGDNYQLIIPYLIAWESGGQTYRNIRCIRYAPGAGLSDEDVTTENPIPSTSWIYGGAQLNKLHAVHLFGTGNESSIYGAHIDTLYEFKESATTIETFASVPHEEIPFEKHPLNVYPTYGFDSDRYIALEMSGHNREIFGQFHLCPYTTMESDTIITPPEDVHLLTPYPERDSINDEIYWAAKVNGANRIITTSLDAPGDINRNFYSPMTVSSGARLLNGGNFFVYPFGRYIYYDNIPTEVQAMAYYVLQRDVDQYHILYSGAFQQRLDISNMSPLVTMDRVLSSISVYDANVSGLMMRRGAAMSGYNLGGVAGSGGIFASGILIDDYRYSDFEWNGGYTLEKDLFAAYNGDLGIADLASLAAFSGIFLSPSGHIIKVEASNFSLPEQYTFLATRGDVAGFGFFEKTPSGFSFVPLTDGFPQVRPTIIRLDDKL